MSKSRKKVSTARGSGRPLSEPPALARGLNSGKSEERFGNGLSRSVRYLRTHLWATALIAFLAIGALGAALKYLDDDARAQKLLPAKDRSALSKINPFFVTTPTPTPQLSKEYIYAGSRLLAVEDANANAAPPADLAIWRPSSGQWWWINSQGQYGVFTWGSGGDSGANPPIPSDITVPGDFDGDGKTDFAVYRPTTGEWWETNSSTGTYGAVTFGTSGDIPAPADFDGDGKTDAAIFRRDTSTNQATFYIHRSSDGSFYSVPFGLNSDIPAPADYDGDGRAHIGVWRATDHMFYSINSSNLAILPIFMGNTTTGADVVSADYDGDGRADYAIYNRDTANWYIMQSTNGLVVTAQVAYSAANDLPVQNDYDGDGKCDIAVWRDSTGHWYINNSSGSTREAAWGQSGDTPVPANYRR